VAGKGSYTLTAASPVVSAWLFTATALTGTDVSTVVARLRIMKTIAPPATAITRRPPTAPAMIGTIGGFAAAGVSSLAAGGASPQKVAVDAWQPGAEKVAAPTEVPATDRATERWSSAGDTVKAMLPALFGMAALPVMEPLETCPVNVGHVQDDVGLKVRGVRAAVVPSREMR